MLCGTKYQAIVIEADLPVRKPFLASFDKPNPTAKLQFNSNATTGPEAEDNGGYGNRDDSERPWIDIVVLFAIQDWVSMQAGPATYSTGTHIDVGTGTVLSISEVLVPTSDLTFLVGPVMAESTQRIFHKLY